MPEMTPSTRELARRIGVTEAALRKAEAKGRIEREPDGQWDVEKSRRRMIETADPVRSPLAGAVGAAADPPELFGNTESNSSAFARSVQTPVTMPSFMRTMTGVRKTYSGLFPLCDSPARTW